MLFLIATPIGHLKDITYRAVETLQECDLILCEDTRVSAILLAKYKIKKPTLSFHRFNERKRENKVIEAIQSGKNVALISDAGTVGICDPGARLVQRCHQEKITITSLPGPSALLTALSLSGTIKERFQFIGYLPKKRGALLKQIEECLDYDGASIAYETPHHLLKTLEIVSSLLPDCPLFLAKELTKRYESYFLGTAKELLEILCQKKIKGEWVIIFPEKRKKGKDNKLFKQEKGE